MFKELDVVELTHNIKEYNLVEGKRGTIVEVYKGGEAYEVEFVASDGKTIALLTLIPHDIRSTLNRGEPASHGYTIPVYLSTASGITFTTTNILKRPDEFTGFDTLRIKTENSRAGTAGFNYSGAVA